MRVPVRLGDVFLVPNRNPSRAPLPFFLFAVHPDGEYELRSYQSPNGKTLHTPLQYFCSRRCQHVAQYGTQSFLTLRPIARLM